ncbi:MAG: helicase-exonuclease AddAB subunit AddA [Lachnospiraceae bacterium]|nr:helicase-exonuclease AddAB subunit AddA [Lachnospiraceae bacterium]
MERQWTKQQQQVIDLKNRNLLVSAAAGSGKTAVLVERIIRKITDKDHPVDIDRLLIVTFTNGAASEMRERIGAAIEGLLEQYPQNAHLQRQQTLLHNAQITTIHSFCLYVIRNYFHRIELDPEFRVAEEGELKLLKSDVLDQVLERYYQEAQPEFLTLSETIATGKNDMPLKDAILKLFEFAMSYPWVETWLMDCKKPFHVENMEDFEALPLTEELLSYLKSLTKQWASQLRTCLELSTEPEGPEMYEAVLSQEVCAVDQAADSSTYQNYYETIQGLSFGRLPAARKFQGDPEKKERVQKLRNEVKSSVKKTIEQFFFQRPEEMVLDLKKNRQAADMLLDVTLSFYHRFAEKKREKNMLDFHDLEHFALRILVEEETRQPSKTALELRRNYEEIMIDEYQDSNYVQETILKAVSKESDQIYNIFMVGDVKQSIYRFRMARPELFMEKYDTYTQEDSEKQRVDLHMNFRSRPQVLQFINHIFYRIMKADIGNITYDDQAALYPGAHFPEGEPGMFEPEFLVIEPEEEDKDTKTQELEARAVGRKIRSLIQEQQVTEQMPDHQRPGSLRPVRYSDMVILLRSVSGWAEVFVKVLGEMGIPARAASGTGYFSAVEVQTALNLLRILDNPRQDIPMAAVLVSPIVGLTGEDLAVIRTRYPEKKFYQAVLEFSEEGEARQESGSISVKLEKFLTLFRKFRKKISYTPIHELLSQVLEETGYQAYVYALPGGEIKRANLEMLVEKAIAYEHTSYRGLFHFIRYMEQLQKYDVDFPLAEGEETEDVVRIMSIHKSKGLEFPVVFVSGLGKMFNNQDIREKVVLHPRLGIGMDVVDSRRRLKTPGITRQFLARKTVMENIGEELRVLYVALTRAKEKLILTGVLKKAEEKLASMEAIVGEDGFLTFLSRLNSNTFLQFLLLARSCQENPYPLTLIKQQELEETERQEIETEGLTRVQLLAKLQEPEPEWEEKMAERLSFVYPYEEEIAMKTKVSVSELKHRAIDRLAQEEQIVWEREDLEQTAREEETTGEKYIPAFMEGVQKENIGAKRGTAMHRLLECYDFSRPPETLEQQLQELEEQKLVEKELLDLIALPGLNTFLRSELGSRMEQAARRKKLYREKPFVMGKPAEEVLQESQSQEMILIQGIIDVFFEEEDGIVLLDYKTDRVRTGQELADRYQAQLELYQEAIERALGKKVKERLLYSFCLGETIAV